VKRAFACILLLVVSTVFVGCSSPSEPFVLAPVELSIHNNPPPSDLGRGMLVSLPRVKRVNGVKNLDLRGYDLTKLSLDKQLKSLMYADFDSVTRWPDQLPDGFDPQLIMELGKDPGLGVRSLHEQGITGKGIGIAIIDQGLLVDHNEYKDQLRHYEEIHCLDTVATLHGAAVASIAVGKTVGVAPEADLYYIAETHGEFSPFGFTWDFTWLAHSLDRIIEINRLLPESQKIRVVSITIGWSEGQKGYEEIQHSVKKAIEEGIFVVSSSLIKHYPEHFIFDGLGRSPYLDPNDVESYSPGSWWAESFYAGNRTTAGKLLIPMDSRCTASPTGVVDYVYYTQGGLSWSIPYIAGLYALACQVKPDVTPQEFWAVGLNTGDTIELSHNGKKYEFGTIVNPVKLIEELSSR